MSCAVDTLGNVLRPATNKTCALDVGFFDGGAATAWAGRWWSVVGTATAAYITLLQLPTPRSPIVTKRVVLLWNTALSVFSCIGSVTAAANMSRKVALDGFVASVCDDASWFSSDAMGLALFLFVLSKPCELIDTVLLKLRSRPVPFLHWYHHVSVMYYAWHAYATRTSIGPWFATVNYVVHAIMYSYYASTQIPDVKRRVARVAPYITVLQISQMLFGISVGLVALGTSGCGDHRTNTLMSLGMYTSYAVLFIRLFQKKRRTETTE